MTWLGDRIKWLVAGREMRRLYRLQSDLQQHRQWLAEFHDVALMLDNIAADHGLPREFAGFDDVGVHDIAQLREKMRGMRAAAPQLGQWQDIESAPMDGRTILLGYVNSHGNWRTMRGQWFTKEHIDDDWEDGDCFQAGWYETSVEAGDVPSCWLTNPTHWMPLPVAPQQQEGGEA